jgi:sugar lactone lactonase YvrE
MRAEIVVDQRGMLGEGPLWDPDRQVLWWIDAKNHKVFRYDPSDGSNTEFDVGQQVGTVVLREKGGLLLSLHHGIGTFDLDTGKLEILCDPEEHLPGNRFNDGKCDPAGRFWTGTMENAEENFDRGAFYSLDVDGTVKKHFDGVGVSNGIVWTADRKTMYYIDSPTRCVDAFDYDETTGAITNRRVAFKVPDGLGFPDGMTIDADDRLWIALWGGFAVRQFDPKTGALIATVEVKAPHVSACAFGGPNLDELYITTARWLMQENKVDEYPLSGGLFHANVGVPGTNFFSYRG